MPTDTSPPPDFDRTPITLLSEEVDDHLDGTLAAIIRESFASEARVHVRGWDGIAPTMIQFLADPEAPSGVRLAPTGVARMGDPPQVADFLRRVVDSPALGEEGALRAKLVQRDARGYLGCAMAFEGYFYPGPDRERRERWGDLPLAEVPDAAELRSLRGVTAEGRRFEIVRVRDGGPPVAVVDAQNTVDPARTATLLHRAIDRLNGALRDAYAR